MSIYTSYLLTPGIEFDSDFVPKASPEDADEAIEREGEGTTAYAMMGYDPEGDRWEVLMVTYRPTTLIRRVRMMFGLKLEWDGDAPLEFDRSQGVEMTKYTTHNGDPVIAFSGLMVGMVAARSEDEMLRAETLAARLGITIKEES